MIASIFNQPRLDPLVAKAAAHQGQVGALDGVKPKLFAQMALGGAIACENDQPARLLVQPVHGPHAACRPAFALGESGWQEVCQSSRQKAAAARAKLGGFFRMAHGRKARRLVDDHDRIV
jgi:hypothetical protein